MLVLLPGWFWRVLIKFYCCDRIPNSSRVERFILAHGLRNTTNGQVAPLCHGISKVIHHGGKGFVEQRCPSHGSQEIENQRKEPGTRCKHQEHAQNIPSPP